MNKRQRPTTPDSTLPVLPPHLAGTRDVVLFGVTYTKIGTIQRRLAWPLHKDDTLVQSGRSTDRNIYFLLFLDSGSLHLLWLDPLYY
ncbi:hypothetical protein BDV93DRAFT_591220 [Ceratobasidium sp. AG-I]|nr:hypothetical protein BDV93DRAFT_591220 [Ceratobasidium sp. AG-I]